jgi:hypothetical protein
MTRFVTGTKLEVCNPQSAPLFDSSIADTAANTNGGCQLGGAASSYTISDAPESLVAPLYIKLRALYVSFHDFWRLS